jgi:hypothetical protein
VGVIYRSPNADICCNQVLDEAIREAVSMKSSHIPVIGDFNYREINWNDQSCNAANGRASHDFLNCVQDCFLYQHATEAIHFCGTQRANVLDLVFINEEAMISDLHYCEPIGDSDHFVLSCQYNSYKVDSAFQFIYKDCNFDVLRSVFEEVDWSLSPRDKST